MIEIEAGKLDAFLNPIKHLLKCLIYQAIFVVLEDLFSIKFLSLFFKKLKKKKWKDRRIKYYSKFKYRGILILVVGKRSNQEDIKTNTQRDIF